MHSGSTGVEVAETVRTKSPSSRSRERLPEIGSALAGRYVLEKEIGRGACAVVFRAEDKLLRVPVALKLLLRADALETDPSRVIRLTLRDEALSAMRLSHPNVVRVYNYERAGGWEFLVMELVEGEDLDTRCRRRDGRRLEPEETVRIGVEALAALAYAHQMGITHNDLKPGNILVRASGGAQLCDFGLSGLHASRPAGAERVVAGTPGFMSPETIRGEAPQPQSDLYSLAASLYAVGNGAPPFGRGVEALLRHLNTAPPPSRHLPPAIDRVLQRALQKAPADRFASAAEMAEALERSVHAARLLPPPLPAPEEFEISFEEPLPASSSESAAAPDAWPRVPPLTLRSAYGGTFEVKSFHLSPTAVTNEEYFEFVEATGAAPPFHWFRKRPPADRLHHPVVGVSLEDARQYAAWRGWRLPTSLEWEAAARAPDGRAFPWGNTFDSDLCHGPGGRDAQTVAVDALKDGASSTGLLQLVGNVWEWTEPDARQPAPPAGFAWAYGGSFQHPCEVDGAIPRTPVTQVKAYPYLGFRCAADVRSR